MVQGCQRKHMPKTKNWQIINKGEISKLDHLAAHITALQLMVIKNDNLRRNCLCGLADWKSRQGAGFVLGSLWDVYTTEPLKLSFITQMTGSRIPYLCSGKLDCEWVLVTDPQGRVLWSDQDLTLILKPVEETQSGCWATKDPGSAWCHLGGTLVQPKGCSLTPLQNTSGVPQWLLFKQKVWAGECLTPNICK